MRARYASINITQDWLVQQTASEEESTDEPLYRLYIGRVPLIVSRSVQTALIVNQLSAFQTPLPFPCD